MIFSSYVHYSFIEKRRTIQIHLERIQSKVSEIQDSDALDRVMAHLITIESTLSSVTPDEDLQQFDPTTKFAPAQKNEEVPKG